MGKLAILEMILFDGSESNQRSCGCLQIVSIYKLQVYKTISRPRVDKGSEQGFIKIILTKDQERSKKNKE